jgi:hypothetical protein
MFDISKEELILVRDLPDHLPKQPSGKKLHTSAVYRWMKHGVQGVRLETIFIAGCRYSSIEALNRFWQRVTDAKDCKLSRQENKVRANSPSDNELRKAGW